MNTMRRKNNASGKLYQIELDEALRIVRDYRAILRREGNKLVIWCDDLPAHVAKVLQKNRWELFRRIGQSHVSVCPSYELHQYYHGYYNRRECCNMCAMLLPWLDKPLQTRKLAEMKQTIKQAG